ncbi:MAG: hypothetical protein M3R00_07100, partial [Pseudomonadota bacterium]|nr:hypothetical protein [Pseudomonadota bacterium]
LADELSKGIRESQAIGPIKHAFRPIDKQINQLYQLSHLMLYLQSKQPILERHYASLEALRKQKHSKIETLEFSRQMIQTENMLQFVKSTLVDAPRSADDDNPVIFPPRKSHSLTARLGNQVQQQLNKAKRYVNSKENTLRPITNAIVTTVVVTLSLTAAVLLFTTGIGWGLIAAIAAVSLVIGICCAAGSYLSVKEDQRMQEIDSNNCILLRQEEQHQEQIESFTKAASALKHIEQIEHRSYNIPPSSPKATQQKPSAEQQLRFANAKIHKLQQENAALKQQQRVLPTKKSTHLTTFSFMKTGRIIEPNVKPVEESRAFEIKSN